MKLPLVSLASLCPVWFLPTNFRKLPTLCWIGIADLLQMIAAVLSLFFVGQSRLGASTHIPFHCVGNLIVVEATVNAHFGNFILDTGTPSIILNNAYYSTALPGRNMGTFMDVHGNAVPSEILFVQSIDIDGLVLPAATAKLMDLTGYERQKQISIAGILGFETFRGRELLIDFQTCQLQLLEEAGSLHSFYYADTLDITMNDHLPCVKIGFAGKKHWFALDSGSEVNLFHLYNLKGRLEHFHGTGRVTLQGLGDAQKKQAKGWLHSLQVGNEPTDSMEVVLVDLTMINSALAFPLDGLLGTAFLKENIVSINYQSKQLYLLQPIENWAEARE